MGSAIPYNVGQGSCVMSEYFEIKNNVNVTRIAKIITNINDVKNILNPYRVVSFI
jgi:hypothetical protein